MQSYQEVTGNQINVHISGDMKMEDRQAFWGYVKLLQEPQYQSLLLDVSELEFIDSAGLALLLNAYDQINGTGKKIILRHPKGQVKQMVDIAKLHALFEVIEYNRPLL